MADNLDFSLPESRSGAVAKTGSGRWLTALAVILQLVVIALVLSQMWGRNPSSSVEGDLSMDELRDLALKLEKRGLADAAADTWRQYLGARGADREKSAKIWFRIGVAYQEQGEFEKALVCYYRSEALGKVDAIAPDLGRRVQESLEALGKFAALRYELADRVGVGADRDAGSDVVAEIGPVKITTADLDAHVEQMVAAQLAQYAAFMDPAQLNQRKEEMLKRFSGGKMRLQVLQQYLGTEVLYRKAREDKLADDPSVRTVLRDAERRVLVQQFMQRELTRRIQITPGDVQMYYEANKKEFADPEQRGVAHILLPDKEKAEAAIRTLAGGAEFAELAGQISTDKATAEDGGVLKGTLRKGAPFVPGVGNAPEFAKSIFATDAGQVAKAPVKTDKGWHVIKVLAVTPERQRSFEEAREQAAKALEQRKQREVEQRLSQELLDHFNVVIHRSKFGLDEEKQNNQK